jgi:hypothetical protein
MSLHGGIFRLWVVASLIWISFIFVFAYQQTAEYPVGVPGLGRRSVTRDNFERSVGRGSGSACDQFGRGNPLTRSCLCLKFEGLGGDPSASYCG